MEVTVVPAGSGNAHPGKVPLPSAHALSHGTLAQQRQGHPHQLSDDPVHKAGLSFLTGCGLLGNVGLPVDIPGNVIHHKAQIILLDGIDTLYEPVRNVRGVHQAFSEEAVFQHLLDPGHQLVTGHAAVQHIPLHSTQAAAGGVAVEGIPLGSREIITAAQMVFQFFHQEHLVFKEVLAVLLSQGTGALDAVIVMAALPEEHRIVAVLEIAHIGHKILTQGQVLGEFEVQLLPQVQVIKLAMETFQQHGEPHQLHPLGLEFPGGQAAGGFLQPGGGEHHLTGLRLGEVHHHDIRQHQLAVVFFRQGDLLGQSILSQAIIAVQEFQIVAFRKFQALVARFADTAVGLGNDLEAGVQLGIAVADFQRTVLTAVIHQNGRPVGVALAQNGVQAVAQEFFRIVNRNNDTDFLAIVHTIHQFVPPFFKIFLYFLNSSSSWLT